MQSQCEEARLHYSTLKHHLNKLLLYKKKSPKTDKVILKKYALWWSRVEDGMFITRVVGQKNKGVQMTHHGNRLSHHLFIFLYFSLPSLVPISLVINSPRWKRRVYCHMALSFNKAIQSMDSWDNTASREDWPILLTLHFKVCKYTIWLHFMISVCPNKMKLRSFHNIKTVLSRLLPLNLVLSQHTHTFILLTFS